MKSSQQWAMILSVALAVAIFGWVKYSRSKTDPALLTADPVVQVSPLPAERPSSTFPSPSASPISRISAPSDDPRTRWVDVSRPPAGSVLREEAKTDFHAVPPSFLAYGARIGRRMELAKSSRDEAAGLLTELKTCTGANDNRDAAPVQARALCLASAQTIGKIWPDLQGQVEEIKKASDPATLKLAARLNH